MTNISVLTISNNDEQWSYNRKRNNSLAQPSGALWNEITAREKELGKLHRALRRSINTIKCCPTFFYQTRKNLSPVWPLQHLPSLPPTAAGRSQLTVFLKGLRVLVASLDTQPKFLDWGWGEGELTPNSFSSATEAQVLDQGTKTNRKGSFWKIGKQLILQMLQH